MREALLERTIFYRKACSRCEGEGSHSMGAHGHYPGGRDRQFSILSEQREMLKRWLANYQEWKRKTEEICELKSRVLAAGGVALFCIRSVSLSGGNKCRSVFSMCGRKLQRTPNPRLMLSRPQRIGSTPISIAWTLVPSPLAAAIASIAPSVTGLRARFQDCWDKYPNALQEGDVQQGTLSFARMPGTNRLFAF